MTFSLWLRNCKCSIERRWALYQALRRKAVARRLATRPRLQVLEERWLLSTNAVMVTSTADDGSGGTLRYAINQVNAGAYNEIDFNIGTSGSAQTINLTSPLPTLTASGVYINGLSQGGSGNTTRLLLELNGANAGTSTAGLLLQGSNCTVSGLIIEGFSKGIEITGTDNIIGGTATGAGNIISGNSGDGVLIDSGGSGNQVLGNFIGTNVGGTAAVGNSIGIEVAGSNNTLGGLWYQAPNVISGNSNDGVKLDSGSSGNVVLGSYIGTNIGGTAAVANKVGIEDGGSSNTIGGSVLGAKNVISGNSTDGVLIDPTATNETMQGNYIGTDYSVSTAIANGTNGVEIQGSGNSIGGALVNSFIRNYIDGNTKGDGVKIASGGSGNQVVGNFIGVDISGTNGLANSIGVEIGGSSNTVGGTSAYYTNVISGNSGDGLLVDSTGAGNVFQSNYVGTDYTGRGPLANSGSGIEIQGRENTVGGTVWGALNVLSGNSADGVRIDSSASGTLVLGNYIGLNLSGAGSNGGNGVNIAGNNNTVGGTATAALNIISGNSADGVLIASGASGNQVLGNWIGTNYYGTAAVANSIGVEVAGNSNTVGGAAGVAGNVLSGNTGDGVLIDSGANGNQVLGDTIGVNYYDGGALANSGNGIEVAGTNNTLGGSYAVAFNEISGNSGDGVKLDKGGSSNVVLGNYIGTNLSGTAAFANSVGIEDGGSSNTIGGSVLGARNVISGNSSDGVLIDSTATNETMEQNYIGLDYTASTVIANGSNGVEIQGSGNTIGGNGLTTSFIRNYIDGNTKGDGVKIDSGASGNQVLGNFIGVDISGTIGLANSIGVEIGGSNNTVGGTSVGSRNVISGNSGDGVLLDSTGAGNVLQNNYVGINLFGNGALGNSLGVEVAGTSNTVGGAAGFGNVISGNTGDGVLIDSGASGNEALGDTIGVNYYDGGALANSGNGIEVAGSNNTLGGSWAVAFNEISGNSGDGVKLDKGSSGNVVMGSYIGTDHTGTKAVANSVGVEDGGSSNTIGGSVLGAKNVISGNSTDGVLIDKTATNETMLGNYIGTDYSVSTALANGTNGVEIQGSGNTIGGALVNSFIRNYIDGNTKGDGVKIDSGASSNQVLGNFIGVNVSGTNGLANSIGVEIGGNSNTVGGANAYYANVISGNSSDGVLVDSTGAGNVFQSNYVGTDYTGRGPLANSGSGIEIQGSGNSVGVGNVLSGNSADGLRIDGTGTGNLVQGSLIGLNISGAGSNGGNGVNIAGNNNTVGGTVTAARNIISGNGKDGVLIASGASGNQVLGNYIGTNSGGTAAAANSIGVEVAGNSNTVGGASGSGNVISGNTGDGVKIDSGASSNQVLGNNIGTNAGGTVAVGNSIGLEVAGSNNTLGGLWYLAANVISGNTNDGVLLDGGSSGNQVLGSYVGTNYTGTAAVANKIGIEDGGSSNTIGGSVLGARNVISGNSSDGVLNDKTATNETMAGNYIGTDYSASTAIANGSNGVEIQGTGNTIGGDSGTNYFIRNFISGNNKDGVLIDSSATRNQVSGNFIGIGISGTNGVANAGNGVEVAGSGNTIGGTTPSSPYAANQVISANGKDGVLIDSGATGNLVQGNCVGTDYTTTNSLANSVGIEVKGNSNTLGGAASNVYNVVSGNSTDGILIDSGVSGTLVQGNYVGTDFTGTSAVANSIGIEDKGAGNTLGGTTSGAGNVISGNSSNGVLMDSSASGTLVLGNSIGLNVSGTALGNGTYGVSIFSNSNTIGGSVSGAGNTIADNTSGGVLVSSGAGNTISQNSIFANGDAPSGPGITLDSGGNNNLASPTLKNAQFTHDHSELKVEGSFTPLRANVSYVLEFFASPSGDAEGEVYLGSLTATPMNTSTQKFTFTTTTTVPGTYPLITATLIDESTGDTSAFSNGG